MCLGLIEILRRWKKGGGTGLLRGLFPAAAAPLLLAPAPRPLVAGGDTERGRIFAATRELPARMGDQLSL